MDAKDILMKAARIQDERGEMRDAPDGERTMGKAVAAFNAVTGRNLTESEGWLMMIMLKAARSRSGKFIADDVDDLVGYASLYGESEYRNNYTELF